MHCIERKDSISMEPRGWEEEEVVVVAVVVGKEDMEAFQMQRDGMEEQKKQQVGNDKSQLCGD